jgi:hypothetical protein
MIERHFASDLGHRFLAAKDFEGRWAVMTETLGALGATAVNAAALDATTERPIWVSDVAVQVDCFGLSRRWVS